MKERKLYWFYDKQELLDLKESELQNDFENEELEKMPYKITIDIGETFEVDGWTFEYDGKEIELNHIDLEVISIQGDKVLVKFFMEDEDLEDQLSW